MGVKLEIVPLAPKELNINEYRNRRKELHGFIMQGLRKIWKNVRLDCSPDSEVYSHIQESINYGAIRTVTICLSDCFIFQIIFLDSDSILYGRSALSF
jgi:hypothetical protein